MGIRWIWVHQDPINSNTSVFNRLGPKPNQAQTGGRLLLQNHVRLISHKSIADARVNASSRSSGEGVHMGQKIRPPIGGPNWMLRCQEEPQSKAAAVTLNPNASDKGFVVSQSCARVTEISGCTGGEIRPRIRMEIHVVPAHRVEADVVESRDDNLRGSANAFQVSMVGQDRSQVEMTSQNPIHDRPKQIRKKVFVQPAVDSLRVVVGVHEDLLDKEGCSSSSDDGGDSVYEEEEGLLIENLRTEHVDKAPVCDEEF